LLSNIQKNFRKLIQDRQKNGKIALVQYFRYKYIKSKGRINMDITTNNNKDIEFKSNVLSAVEKAFLELDYTNIKRSIIKDNTISPKLSQKETIKVSYSTNYSYICDKKEFSLQFLKLNDSCKAVFNKPNNKNGYDYSLQINEDYKYCGTGATIYNADISDTTIYNTNTPDTNIPDEIIKSVELENGNLLNITKKILQWMLNI